MPTSLPLTDTHNATLVIESWGKDFDKLREKAVIPDTW